MGPVIPMNYDITFEPDLKKFIFRGKEKISLHIRKPVNKLALNILELKITYCILTTKGRILKPKLSLDKKKEELVLKFPEKISGNAELFINFEGLLTDKLAGFYRSKYTHKGKIKYLATSQFEATDARRAFPCWDHPEYKATFNISMIIDKKLDAISNMPIIEEKKLSGNKKFVKFAQTPIMSPYLVYLGVGEFESVKGKLGNISLGVWTTPDQKNRGKLALDFSKKFVKFYQDYFQIKYPLPKLDLIAIPDFASGAMENWGAITFREVALLFDKKTSSTATKQIIAEIISHEIAHQWFGDLVTMKWWNDLWLNESFATFMGNKAVDHYFPKWEMRNQFLDDSTEAALELDALKTSHPIDVEVKEPSEIAEIFDQISYDKGGSVLRMLEGYLGKEVFRKGLKQYLLSHKFGNATTQNLWSSLEKVSKKPVKKMMNTWIKQTGFPLVEAELKNSKLILSQKRFLYEGMSDNDKSLWFIPLSIKSNKKSITGLMTRKKIELNLDKNYDWFKINFNQTGFYRVKYPREILKKQKILVRKRKLPYVDIWGIQNDLFANAIVGKNSLKEYLDFAKLCTQDDFLISKDIEDKLYFLYLIAPGKKFWPKIIKFSRTFFNRVYNRVGWEPRKNERHTDALLRAQTLIYLGRFEDKKILEKSLKAFNEFLKKPASLHPDLRSAVLNNVAWKGDKKTLDTFVNLYNKATTQEEKRRYLSAMAGFKKKELLDRTLEFSLSKHVRLQDVFIPVTSISYNPYGRKLVCPWIKENWKELEKMLGGPKNLLSRIIESLGSLSNHEDVEIKKFFDKHPTPGIKRSVAQTLEKIRIRSKFVDQIRYL